MNIYLQRTTLSKINQVDTLFQLKVNQSREAIKIYNETKIYDILFSTKKILFKRNNNEMSNELILGFSERLNL